MSEGFAKSLFIGTFMISRIRIAVCAKPCRHANVDLVTKQAGTELMKGIKGEFSRPETDVKLRLDRHFTNITAHRAPRRAICRQIRQSTNYSTG